MNVRLDRRLLGSAAGSQREIGDAIRREPASLEARETGEIEVTSGKIQAKLVLRQIAVRRTDGGAPGKWSIVGTGIDVVELKLATGEAEIALQQRNAHSVGHAIVKLEVSISMRIGARTRNGGGQIESASKRRLNSSQLNKLRHIGVADVKVQSKRSTLRKCTPCQWGTGVEVRRGVA